MSGGRHSVHVDRVDAVTATIHALEQPQPIRHEASDLLVDLIHEHLRDSTCVVSLRVEGLTRDEWEQADGRQINGWKKRREIRSATGALIAAVDLETDEDFWGRA
jgi:hypothetical protein